MPLLESASRWANAACYAAEHPNVIRGVEKKVILPLGALGMGALAVNDFRKAPDDQKRNVMIRDAFVLGGTAIGTMVAARGMGSTIAGKLFHPLESAGLNTTAKGIGKSLKSVVEKGLMSYDEYEGRVALKEMVDNGVSELQKKGYSKNLQGMLEAMPHQEKGILGGYHKIISTMKQEFQQKHGTNKTLWNEHFKSVFKEPEEESSWDEFKEALSFFAVGGLSVLSGFGGGLLANKVNGVSDKKATLNMIKEGIFQFVANIALCAVGAIAALAFVNGEWGKGPLKQPAEKFKTWLKNSPAPKLIRTGIIGMGLSIGIFGGGHIANWLGRNYINPWCDKMQGKTPDPRSVKQAEKRHIEFSDAILHLDDVPTAMALAGVEIVTPFIPLFFAFSGYRTGIGYRNDASSPKPGSSTPVRGNDFRPNTPNAYGPQTMIPVTQGFGKMQPTFATAYSRPARSYSASPAWPYAITNEKLPAFNQSERYPFVYQQQY